MSTTSAGEARQRQIANAGDLLRLILVHAAADLPLRQTVALVAETGGHCSVRCGCTRNNSSRRVSPCLVTAMVDTPMGLAPEKWAGYVVSAVDATVISRTGSVNGNARIHARLRLADLKYLQIRSTGIDEGETFCRFGFEPGELIVTDRGYCNASGVARVLDAGADVLVRVNRSTSLPEPEAAKARKRAREEHGLRVSADTLEAAGYVILFTTTPSNRLSRRNALSYIDCVGRSKRISAIRKTPRFGLGLSATRVGRVDRRDRLLLIGALAQVLLTLLGAASEETGLDRTLKANTVKLRSPMSLPRCPSAQPA